MSVQLHRGTQQIDFSQTSWYQLLRLAYYFGWQPAGTQIPPPAQDPVCGSEAAEPEEGGVLASEQPWNGSYFNLRGQWVTDEDARRLAEAIERAWPHLPADDVLSPEAGEPEGISWTRWYRPVDAPGWFSGPRRQQLGEFVAF